MKNEIGKEMRGPVWKDTFRRCSHKRQPAQITNRRGADGREGTKLKGRETHCVCLKSNHPCPSPKPPNSSFLVSPLPSITFPLLLKHFPTTSCSSPLHRVQPCTHNGVEKVGVSGVHALSGGPWPSGTAIESGVDLLGVWSWS